MSRGGSPSARDWPIVRGTCAFSSIYLCICAVPGSFFSIRWMYTGCHRSSPFIVRKSSEKEEERILYQKWTRKRDTASAATWRRSLDGRGTQWRAVAFLLVTCDLLCWRLRNAFACLFNLFKWSCKRGYNVVGLWTISEIEDWEMGNLIFVSFVPFSWVNFGIWIERCKNCYTSFG